MDNSELYVRMSEAAWPLLKQEFEGLINHGSIPTMWILEFEGKRVRTTKLRHYRGAKMLFPLSRQDQLQGMVDRNHFELLQELSYVVEEDCGYLNKFTSMEQLWLAFVMNELHNLKWGGKEWKKN